MESFVEKEWTHCGFLCQSVATGMGHRCGYVGVDRYHRLHGVGHSEKSDLLKVFANGFRGTTPEGFFSVHGGLTFADKREEHPDLWFFGFDCAHANDLPDESLMTNIPENLREILSTRSAILGAGTVWTLDMVVVECERLAQQLSDVMNGPVWVVDERKLSND
jgi:hypothetical protein